MDWFPVANGGNDLSLSSGEADTVFLEHGRTEPSRILQAWSDSALARMWQLEVDHLLMLPRAPTSWGSEVTSTVEVLGEEPCRRDDS